MEESPPPETDCKACREFGTMDPEVGREEFRMDSPPCPLTEVVLGDFS